MGGVGCFAAGLVGGVLKFGLLGLGLGFEMNAGFGSGLGIEDLGGVTGGLAAEGRGFGVGERILGRFVELALDECCVDGRALDELGVEWLPLDGVGVGRGGLPAAGLRWGVMGWSLMGGLGGGEGADDCWLGTLISWGGAGREDGDGGTLFVLVEYSLFPTCCKP